MKKLQLNDVQWEKLVSLGPAPRAGESLGTPPKPSRLSSHGLVAADSLGREYLTDKGVYRLSQGR